MSIKDQIPIGRWGETHDIGNTVILFIFLCTNFERNDSQFKFDN